MLHIRVPATSANMGSGFDSIGIALKLYNHLWFEEIEKGVEIETKRKQLIEIPTDKTNLIYRTMVDFYAEIGKVMPGVRLIQEDYIPATRGLGSSAACIVAGLMAANHLSGCNYGKDELAQIAAKIEGHPDNSNPALLGGMVVGALDNNEMRYVKVGVPENLRFAIMVPDFPVSTSASRNVLPNEISRQDAIFNVSRAGLLVASMMTGNIDNLKMAMDDRLHQPYRRKLIPEMDRIFKASKGYGAVGTYLSGAGSTLMAVLTDSNAKEFENKMSAYLSSMPHEWELTLLEPDMEGAVIISE
ncbi:MAG: homoserine kinase [Tyzzerella sp.]|uniref:Homoserine kinase n=1 Tax=Candidatus Fimicola merdigallinarum TaxID=2840819 RepID=A0A9D9DXQ5_9FIRM|nr:homoserine kinase [Candidatus Fimicola merdigallinarum]